MRSFTSSSKTIATEWLITTLLFVLAISAYEITLARLGVLPSVTDSKSLWSSYRTSLAGNSHIKQQLIVVGASRAQLGLSLQALREAFPNREPVMLAINGKYPMATLMDLLLEDQHSLLLLVAIDARGLVKKYWQAQQSYVDYFHNSASLTANIDALLKAKVQAHFRASQPRYSPWEGVLSFTEQRRWPHVDYVTMNTYREIDGDYTRVDASKLRRAFATQLEETLASNAWPTPKEWLAELTPLRQAVHRFRAQGNEVAFLRMPTQGPHYDLDEGFFPKAEYWDTFAETIGAPTIHFRDYPALGRYSLPDGSHLDYRDKDTFTQSLAQIIRSQVL